MADLASNLHFKSRACFTASLQEGKNARFLAINHGEVPCTPDQLHRKDKATPIRFTILKPLSAGFSSAPYKATVKGVKGDNKDTKRITEMSSITDDNGKTVPAMNMWSFKKSGAMADKGPRIEDHRWVVTAGNTIILWIDEDRLSVKSTQKASQYSDPIVPEGLSKIPAFTVCEITISPKNDDRASEGRGLKIVSVKPVGFSLYSMAQDLQYLSKSLPHARLVQTKLKEAYPCIEKELETKDVPFLAQVVAGAVIEDADVETTGMVKLTNWGDASIPRVDIPVETMLKYTNSTRVDWAMALLDVAIASNALSLLVFSSEQWVKGLETGFRAVPIIDTEILLANLTSSLSGGDSVSVECDAQVDVDGTMHGLSVTVETKAHPVETGTPPQLEDFPLVGPLTELQSAHGITFSLINKITGDVTPSIWKGYFNVSPQTVLSFSLGSKRKRLQSMDI